ncbi:predicted protein [Chaetoceros tenuissimus]|uniref:Uncharacterized protein n=1 Tax=Chaetoceros tenuissimus TaxID=426638 RepID=A0AAD3D873_9STRA|nr:predicted protein [Chaetoceros tenuissimus]
MKSSVYHQEVLTALTGDLEAPESKSNRNGKLNMGILLLCLGLFVAIVLIPGFVLFHKQGLMFILDLNEAEHRFEYIVTCLSFLPVCIFMVWSIREVAIAETAKACFSRTSLLLVLCLLIEHLKVISSEMTEEELEHINMFVLNRALAFSVFTFWMSLLDDVALWVHSFADQIEKILRESPESEEWKNKMKKASKFGNKKIDAGDSILGGSRSPSRVLAEVTGVYCNLGKALGFMLLFLYMVGVNLYSSLVIFRVTVLFAAIIQALHINEAMSNLIPLHLVMQST